MSSTDTRRLRRRRRSSRCPAPSIGACAASTPPLRSSFARQPRIGLPRATVGRHEGRPSRLYLRAASSGNHDHAPDAQRASRRRDAQVRRLLDAVHAVVWNKVFPRIPVDAMRKPVPRIHRDRIQVTRDSAEMGEEILWEHFFPHIHEESHYSVLDGSTSNPAFERFYREHLIKLELVRGRSRYVSKAISACCGCSICARCSPTRASCSTFVTPSITSPH